MNTRLSALVMTGVLGIYLVVVGQRAYIFIASGDMLGQMIGVALMVLPVIAVWAVVRELLFGFRAERLMRLMNTAEILPTWAYSRERRRKNDPENMARHEACIAEVSDNPDVWQAWMCLGISYDKCGNRREARKAIRHAIGLHRLG